MSEQRPPYADSESAVAPANPTGWRARLLEELEKAVKNWNRPAIIVIRWDGCGGWQVMPTVPPTARIEINSG